MISACEAKRKKRMKKKPASNERRALTIKLNETLMTKSANKIAAAATAFQQKKRLRPCVGITLNSHHSILGL